MPQTTSEWRANATEAELRGRAKEMRSEWAELSKSDRTSDTFRTSKVQFLNEMDDIDTNLTLRQMADEVSSYRSAPRGSMGGSEQDAPLSPGQQLVSNDGFRSWMRTNASADRIHGSSPTVEVRDLVTLGSSSNLTLPVLQPTLIGVRRRRLFLRQLLSVVQVTQAAVPYFRELNAATNETAAGMFQEGGTTPKPEAKIEFAPDLAHVGTIAVNIPLTTQMLEDSTFIQGYVDTRLAYMLSIKEEDELLNGDGTGLNLRGIMHSPGLQTEASPAGETAIGIMEAMTDVEVKYGYADGVVMHPKDASKMFTNRAAGGSGTFDAGDPFSSIPLNVWGQPVVRSMAIAQGHALVGAFAMGATVLDRRSTNIHVYEQHADYAVLNRVLVQAEERVGLMVTNPDWFVDLTLTPAA